MDNKDWLAERFEENRSHLRSVAYRMLGSLSEADDAVQESWISVSRADTSEVRNIGGWLTTVVARTCLDMLRSRKSRREDSLFEHESESIPDRTDNADPEREVMLADSVGIALLVVLETLTPAERLAFVLHDLFAVPFDEIAPVVGKTPEAARQLASRARRRVQTTKSAPEADQARQRQVVEAFLAAARGGNFEALLTMLDPDVVMRSDEMAVKMGNPSELKGAAAVASLFNGQAQDAVVTLIDGVVGAMWAPRGKPRAVLQISVRDGRIIGINTVCNPADIGELDLVALD